MNTNEKDFIDKIKEQVLVEIGTDKHLTEDGIEKIAKRMEKIRKFRVKDYEAVLAYFKNISYFMKEDEEDLVDKDNKNNLHIIEESKKVVEKIIENRRERNRNISRVDTNILTHAPYFAGGSRKRREKGKKDGYILVEKEGLRDVTYENEMGEMLTMVDAKTIFALFTLWEQQGYKDWIKFTEYQLLEVMSLKIGGKQYNMVRQSLEKLWNTSLVMQEAYDVTSGKREVTRRFKLIVADKISKEFSTEGNLRSKNYEIQFSEYVNVSIEGGYYSLISLAVFNELEINTAQGIYLMMTGINDMDRNDTYIRRDGSIEIDLDEVYNTLYLESERYRNRELVEKGCEELKEVGVISDFYFKYNGRSAVKIVIEPSEWHLDVIKKKESMLEVQDTKQLSFKDMEGSPQEGKVSE